MAYKLDYVDLYQGRLDRIEEELKREYCKGKRRSRSKIAKLLHEKEDVNKYLQEVQQNEAAR